YRERAHDPDDAIGLDAIVDDSGELKLPDVVAQPVDPLAIALTGQLAHMRAQHVGIPEIKGAHQGVGEQRIDSEAIRPRKIDEPVRTLDALTDVHDRSACALADEGIEYRGLVLELQVHRALRYAGARGDVRHRRRRPPAFKEEDPRGVQDPAASIRDQRSGHRTP